MSRLRRAARVAAHLVVLLLAATWTSAAGLSLSSPLFDIARPRVGDMIITICNRLALSPAETLLVAHGLAILKLALGLYLLLTVAVAIHDRVRWGASDDAMLDVGLLLSAIGSAISVLVFAPAGGPQLVGALGEVILCGIAGLLAAYGDGARLRSTVSRPAGSIEMHPA